MEVSNILVLVPNLVLTGGVASYYNALELEKDARFTYFIINKGRPEPVPDTTIRLLKNYLLFVIKLIKGRYKSVIINPSLNWRSFHRDSIFIIIARLLGKETIVFFHGWEEEFEKKIMKSGFKSLLFKLSFARAGRYMVLGNIFKNKLLAMGVPSNSKFYIETTVVDSSYPEDINLKNKFLTFKQEIKFLFLARIIKEKGIFIAIDAFKDFTDRFPQRKSTLTIAGDGPDLSAAESYVTEKGITNIIFKGNLNGDAKRKVLQESHIMILPSYTEGLPISMLEGMLYGMPIIARETGGIPEIIENEKNGYITKSFDPLIFTNFLIKLASNNSLYEKIAETNHNIALKRFTKQKVKGRFLKILYNDKAIDEKIIEINNNNPEFKKLKKKILIVFPSLTARGGVSELYHLSDFRSDQVDYFQIYGPFRDKISRLDTVYMLFRFAIRLPRYQIIYLNPSLNKKSFIRDSILVLISRISMKKVLVYWHGWEPNLLDKIKNHYLYRLAFNYTFKWASASIVLAETFRKQLVSLGYVNPIYIERNSADNKYILEEGMVIKEKFLHKPVKLLLMSRIEKKKGMYIASETVKILNEKSPDNFELIIAGDGNELGNFKQYILKNRISNIKIVGHVKEFEKHELLKNTDIVFFPTWYDEGMPLTILEGLIYGIPVISRPVGGIPDIIKDGINGFLTESKDPKVFAELILKLCCNPDLYQSISDNNARIAQEFSPESFKKRINQIIDSI